MPVPPPNIHTPQLRRLLFTNGTLIIKDTRLDDTTGLNFQLPVNLSYLIIRKIGHFCRNYTFQKLTQSDMTKMVTLVVPNLFLTLVVPDSQK